MGLLLLLIVPGSIQGYGNQVIVNVGYNGLMCYQEPEDADQFLPSEKDVRKQLYWLHKHNPYYFTLKNFPIDYCSDIITEHIKELESKIAAKQNGLRSNAMFRGVVFLANSLLWCHFAYNSYVKKTGSDKTEEAIIATAILSTASAVLGLLAGNQFDKVYRYAQRLVERLKRDKRIFIALEKAKAAKDSNVANGSV